MSTGELEEIAHTGGKVRFNVRVDADGRVSYSVGWSHSNPTRAALFAVYALPQGNAVADIHLGGIGVPWNPAPVDGCVPVLIASDSQGMFGAMCPHCGQYWRYRYRAERCPYCAAHLPSRFLLLTAGQRRYVAEYCRVLGEALSAAAAGEHVIDMDAIIDAIGSEHERPPFYYSEVRQQNHFTCPSCDEETDVLGTYAYCSGCATRNDLGEFARTAQSLRDRVNEGGPPESCVRDAVAAFDVAANQIAAALVARVPMSRARRARLTSGPYHNLARVREAFREACDIDIAHGMTDDEFAFVELMFHRRHVYEHRGGEADQRYIDDSGDDVRVKQALRETRESAHRTVSSIAKLVSNLQKGFHELLPPDSKRIEAAGRRHTKRANPDDAESAAHPA